jgi:tRNA (guanine-N7-)-methyltransferase
VENALLACGHNPAPMKEEAPLPSKPDHKLAEHRPIRSFVVRAGRMGTGQQRALVELAPRYVMPHENAPLDMDAAFGRQAPRVLEIGFGMGDATAEVAAAHPDRDFIGIEVHPPGVGALLQRIEERQLSNLRIFQHDAVEVLRDRIPPRSLAGVHIWFPDPWHKKRHHKRRLIQPAFVATLVQHIAPGGYLHCATDWQPYAEQMLEVLSAEPGLRNTAQGFAPKPDWRPLTKFEKRGLNLGHGVWDLLFTRSS